MKLFISWSGPTSHKVALILRDWIPSVLQAVEPYVSSEDIDKGARWSTDISRELADSNYGILCVTRDNLRAPWLNFEAGALSKSFDKARVSPFLFGLDRTDVTGPLLQFQSTITEKEDLFRLIHSINEACDDSTLGTDRLNRILEVWWPTLDKQLTGVPSVSPAAPEEPPAEARSGDEVLRELLELVRGQQRLLSSPEELLPPAYLQGLLLASRARTETNISAAALRDLEESWYRLRESISADGTLELPPEVEALMLATERPLKYILRRRSSSDALLRHQQRLRQEQLRALKNEAKPSRELSGEASVEDEP